MSVFLCAWDALAQVKHIPDGAGLARGLSRAIEESDQGAAILLTRRAEALLKAYNPDQPRWPSGDPRAGQWRPQLGTGRGRVSPGHLERDIAKLNGLIADATHYGPRLSGHDFDRIGSEIEKVALRYSTRKTYEKRLADLHAERTRIQDAKWAAFEKAWHAATPEKAMEMDAAQFLSAKDAKHLKALADEQTRLLRERDRADRDAMLGVLQKIRPMGGQLKHTSAGKNTIDSTSDIERVYGQEHPSDPPPAAMNADLEKNLRAVLKVVPKAWLDDTNGKGEVSFEFSTERAFASTKSVEEKPSPKGPVKITGKQNEAIQRAVNQGGSYEGMYDKRYPVVRMPDDPKVQSGEQAPVGPYAPMYVWLSEDGHAQNLQYEPSAPPGGYDKNKWDRKAPQPPVLGKRQNTLIRIDPRAENQNTLLHELSHRLEIVYGNEGISGYNPIAQATHGFLYERAGSETPQKLQDLYPGYAYEEHELARPDKFVDGYIGKLYGDQVTEVLTMGMEMLWFPRYGGRDINKDPGMRRLILGLLAAA